MFLTCVAIHHVSTHQSLLGPLQGFFNAIVYGWAQDNFVTAVVISHSNTESEMSRRSAAAQKKESIELEYDTDNEPL